jgi:hypothetical protein
MCIADRDARCRYARQLRKLLRVGQELIEVAFEQDIAAESFFDRRLLRMGDSQVDTAEAVADQLGWLRELDAMLGQQPGDPLAELLQP